MLGQIINKKAGYLGKREFDEFELAWTSFDGKCKIIRFFRYWKYEMDLTAN